MPLCRHGQSTQKKGENKNSSRPLGRASSKGQKNTPLWPSGETPTEGGERGNSVPRGELLGEGGKRKQFMKSLRKEEISPTKVVPDERKKRKE